MALRVLACGLVLVLSSDAQCCQTMPDDLWYYIVPYGAVKYSLVLFIAVW